MMNNDLISRKALLEQECFMDDDNGFRCSVVLSTDVRRAPAVDAGPKWISVEERMPEKSGDYLAFTEKGIFMVLSYSEIHRAFNAYDWCENITPIRCTHWMPLPEVKEHD